MTIDADAFRTFFETDLSDEALEALIADADAYCTLKLPAAAQTVLIQGAGRYLVLPQPVTDEDDIDLIVERLPGEDSELEAEDWRVASSRMVERLSGDTAVFWGGCDVQVTYTPKADADRRDRVVVDLVKLAIQYSALGSERAGDFAETELDYASERERIVRQLLPLGVL